MRRWKKGGFLGKGKAPGQRDGCILSGGLRKEQHKYWDGAVGFEALGYVAGGGRVAHLNLQ